MRSLVKRVLIKILNRIGLTVLKPKKSAKPNAEGAIYSTADFAEREEYRPNYEWLCRVLADLTPFTSALDVGAANGFVVDALTGLGKQVQGVELSEAVIPLLSPQARERIIFADATTIGRIGEFDLVSCIEVAEHVPPDRSEALVETIAVNAGEWVYFTAAPPYQPGVGHINCRPHFFWLNEFRNHGFELDYEMTNRLLQRINGMSPCTWIPQNSLILRRSRVLLE